MHDQRYVPARAGGNDPAEWEATDLPVLIRDAGNAARFAFEEFFQGQIRNPFTRKAYLHVVRSFSEWCVSRRLELVRVTPADVGRYLDSLPVAAPTRKLHLAALRRFFDGLVLRHVLILNPALSVRGDRHQVIEGKVQTTVRKDAHVIRGHLCPTPFWWRT